MKTLTEDEIRQAVARAYSEAGLHLFQVKEPEVTAGFRRCVCTDGMVSRAGGGKVTCPFCGPRFAQY